MRHSLSVLALLASLSLVNAQAAETHYDLTTCLHGKLSVLSASKALTVFAIDTKGLSFSNNANKTFDGSTVHCVGVGKVTSAGAERQGFCKYLQPNGDVLIGGFKVAPGKPNTWTVLSGTGELAGIEGGGTFEQSVRGKKPMAPGEYSACSRAKGSYTLP